MALVEIVASNLHAGANLRKLEVGSVVEVDDETAKRWISTGKAKDTDKKKGEKLVFEVATPSAPTGDLSDLQKQLADALEQNQKLIADGEAKDKAHADALEQNQKLIADGEAKDKAHADALEQNQKLIADGEAKDKAHADALAAETKRADEAEAALAEAIKKAK
ncbi:hypothetical protein AA629_000134 [Enterobacter hormaechei]|nr:hypothetical protein [Enterobacter hormaechei]